MSGKWERGSDEETVWVDLVFYDGKEKKVDFSELEEAAIAVFLQIDSASDMGDAVVSKESGRLALTWKGMDLSIPVKPAKVDELQQDVR